MNTTLLIMAAGIGSRFGTGIKQLEPVDASNHIIMDYSIHDAIEAGFNHVVFIIRKDIEKEFKEVIGDRIAAICSANNVTVDYAFQDIKDIPGTLPEGRTKPWGTVKTVKGAEADGVAVDVNSLVSMNMWGLTPEFLDVLDRGFREFFEKEVPENPLKAEYLIPIFIGELLSEDKMSVKVLKTNDTWYGMTYHEDVAAVKDSFRKMLEDGVYKADLFADL